MSYETQPYPVPVSVGDAGPNGSEPVPTGAVDPDVLWEGEKKSLAGLATGGVMSRARYRITRERILFEAGTLSTSAEQVPMWAVRDLDLRQSMTQKARGVGDLVVRVEHSDYTGRPEVVLESIEKPRDVRDILNHAAEVARREHQQRAATQTLQHVGTPSVSSGPVKPGMSTERPSDSIAHVADELKKLAELRDLGVLTDEEFAAHKSRLLGQL